MQHYRKVIKKQLGEVLVERGALTLEQLKESLACQKEKGGLLGEILVERKFCSEEDIAQSLTCQYGFPYLPLQSYEIEEAVVKFIPADMCQKFCLIPIDKLGDNLTIAMANPLDVEALEDVEKITGFHVQAFVSTASEIKKAIEHYY